jgi:DNA-binding GntR family transcriptional regulator
MNAPHSTGSESRIHASIFDSVMSHRLLPGTRLPEAALSDLFGVSRTIVRQVLRRLAHEHIVQLRPNRGAIVAQPTPAETRAVFEARRALEAAVLPLVVRNATKGDFASLRRHLDVEHEAVGRSDQPAWARLASAFHLRLADLAGNAILRDYLSELMSRCSLIVALYERPGNASCEHEEHARIVDLIEQGDAAEAAVVMGRHLDALERRICLEPAAPTKTLAHMLGFQTGV